MDILNNLLFWLHLVGLGLGAVASFGLPVVGRQMPTATAETRPTLFKVAEGMSTLGRAGFAILIVTGPLLVWLKFGGTSGFTAWFWAKMILVVILLGIVIFAGINAKRAEGGDREAGRRAGMIGMAALVVYLGVILCAVFAFN
jgi:uncharacterized membrane protein